MVHPLPATSAPLSVNPQQEGGGAVTVSLLLFSGGHPHKVYTMHEEVPT